MKLKTQFLIPSAIVLCLGMGGLTIAGYLTSKSAITTVTSAQMAQIASSVSQAADVWFSDRRRDMAGWASDAIYAKAVQDSFIGKSARKSAASKLLQISDGYGYYESVNLATPDGNVVASSVAELVGSLSIAGTEMLDRVLAGETVLIDSHRSALTGEPVILTAAPVREKDDIRAILFGAISLNDFHARFVEDSTIGESGRTMLFNSSGEAIIHPDADQLLTLRVNELTTISGDVGAADYTDGDVERVGFFSHPESLGWVVLVDAAGSEILKPANDLGKLTAAISLAVMLVMGIAIYVSLERMIRPIRGLTEAMGVLAGGKTNVEVPSGQRKDEIGEMGRAVQVFKDNAIEMGRLEIEQKQAQRLAEEEKRRGMTELADRFETSVGVVVQTVSDGATNMEETAKNMTALADRTNHQSEAVNISIGQATENVQTVAAATEELSSSIDEITRQVAQSNTLSKEAVDQANRTNDRVESLAAAATKIGEVVTLIQDIAEQTNLLALNATIEAARAGELGKGFAVVASEVKNLANQTGKATEEIASQISDVQTATTEAVSDIQDVGRTISSLNEIASAVAAAVEEQSAATREIAANVQQASTGTQEVSSTITEVSAAASETGSSASKVLSAAGMLSGEADKLRSEVGNFLAEVRAG